MVHFCAISLAINAPRPVGAGASPPAYDLVLTRNGDSIVTRTDEDVSPRS